MPANDPRVGEIWEYHNVVNVDGFLYHIPIYCFVENVGDNGVLIRYKASRQKGIVEALQGTCIGWPRHIYSKSHFVLSFKLVDLQSKLPRSALAFIEDLEEFKKEVQAFLTHNLPQPKSTWEHLMGGEED